MAMPRVQYSSCRCATSIEWVSFMNMSFAKRRSEGCPSGRQLRPVPQLQLSDHEQIPTLDRISANSGQRTIAFISQVFCQVAPPRQNSTGIWTYEVATRLAPRHRPIIFAKKTKQGPARAQYDGVDFEFIPGLPHGAWRKAADFWQRFHRSDNPLVAQSFFAYEYIRQIALRLRAVKPDIIHVQNFPSHVPLLRRSVPNAAIILHMHCDWLLEFDRALMAKAIAAADLVVGCSAHVVNGAKAAFPDLDVPFAVLPNGSPVDLIASKKGQREKALVLFVGRLSAEKGLHNLITAWPKVIAAHPDARLDLVGPAADTPREMLIDLSSDPAVQALSRYYAGGAQYAGKYREALRQMLSPNIAQTVNIVGPEPYESVVERYAKASLLVNPSLSESFGMSLVESMAAGTPVVATRVGGMTEIVDGTGGGLLVEKDDPSALADAIIRLLDGTSLACELGSRGAAEVAKRYAWDAIADMTEAYHAQAIAARQRSA